MSDSEFESQSSSDTPTAQSLEKGLRDTVASIFRTGNTDELTVKRVRLATERALGLDEGFFKSHSTWKGRSNQIIREEVEAQEQLEQEEEQPVSAARRKREELKAKATKRTSGATSQTLRKKRKKDDTPEPDQASRSLSAEEDEEDDIKGSGRRRPTSTTTSTSQSIDDAEASQVVDSGSDSGTTDEPKSAEKLQAQGSVNEEDNAGSESEMSVLIDEEPEPKKKQKKTSKLTQGKKQKAPAKKRKEPGPEDPDQAEIKRLQGWLFKCGIRKMWSRELAPYDSSKSKIKHLKQMLKDAGMEGRYSTEKANRIREERELVADLEFVQEGAKKWGKADSEDEGRPRRRLARGFKSLDFLEDEGEEVSD